jgi:Phosphotransferase system cellobiose-specific component IIC
LVEKGELESMNLDNFQDKLMGFTAKLQKNIYIQTITQGMMGAMGVLIGGSIVNIIVNLPIPGWQGLLQSIGLYDLLSIVIKIFQCTAPITAFNIGYALARFKGVNKQQAGIISLMSFMITLPVAEGEVIAMTSMNAQNIASSMVIGLLASAIFCWATKKNIKFNLPDSIPPFVSESLGAIPASVLTIVPFIVLRGIFDATSFATLPGFINAVIAAPLQGFGNNLSGHIVFLLVSSLCWWFGIHNMPIILTAYVTMYPAYVENLNTVLSGAVAPNLLSWQSFMLVAQLLGGPGCCIGLYIVCLLFSKSERYKAQSKIQFIPGIFNIIEPAFFGMPTILNTMFLLPMLVTPVIIELLLYFCLKIGIVGTPVATVGNFLPAPITGFLLGGGIGLGIFVLGACVISCVCYYPFFKAADKQALKEEAEMATE